jgi:hypothetical protein
VRRVRGETETNNVVLLAIVHIHLAIDLLERILRLISSPMRTGSY